MWKGPCDLSLTVLFYRNTVIRWIYPICVFKYIPMLLFVLCSIIKHSGQKQLRWGEDLCGSHITGHSPSPKDAKPGTWKKKPWKYAVAGLLIRSSLARFLIQNRVVCIWIICPSIVWAQLHCLAIKAIPQNISIAQNILSNPQMRLLSDSRLYQVDSQTD